MSNKIKDINDIFSMFHDFGIEEISLNDGILTMGIYLPWAEMWDMEDYILTFKFKDCHKLECIYHISTQKPDMTQKSWWKLVTSEERTTNDTDIIKKLELDVQSHEFTKPNNFKLACNSGADYDSEAGGSVQFAILELTVSDYQIFDNQGKEITLDKMKEWGTTWWENIFK